MTKVTEVLREFKLSSFALKNKISVFVLIFIILLMGWSAYTTMPKESFPEIVQPTIYIGTAYPGNSPIDMENLVTRPIEKEINPLNGVKKFTSTSIQDYATIIVEFEFDVDPQEALTEVKDAVDRAKAELPTDLPADPNVFELDFSEFPVMFVNVFGDYDKARLKEYAEQLRDDFEKLTEISGVDIQGLVEEEVSVTIDLELMESLQISFDDVANAISQENVSMSAGDIQDNVNGRLSRRSLRIDGEIRNYQEFGEIVVKHENQEVVQLKDIARIGFGEQEPTSFSRMDGENVLTLAVKKKSGENLIDAADKIRALIDKAQSTWLPADLQVLITQDQSKFTKVMVDNLENSIISGVLLVILVLMFFLGIRNAMFVGIAIPLSMLMGIAFINYTGNTLNMMVLFSLILALGLLVDNGIVVVENIYRLYSQGNNREDASRYGVGEVAMPIIASTATTLMAFIPLLFWNDLMGEFMKFLPITLIIVLSSSLFVGLVVNPVLTSRYMKLGLKDMVRFRTWIAIVAILVLLGALFVSSPASRGLGSLMVVSAILMVLYRYVLKPSVIGFQERVLPRMERAYARLIGIALRGRNPVFFFIAIVLAMIFSQVFYAYRAPKTVMFPDNVPNYVNVFIEMPLGTDIRTTNEFTQVLEDKIAAAVAPNDTLVESILASVGEGTSDPNDGPQQGSSPHKARINVSFYEYEKRVRRSSVSTLDIMADIRAAVEDVPGARITIGKEPVGPPVGAPINLEVSHEDYDLLIIEATKLLNIMLAAEIPGVDQLKLDLELDRPEAVLTIDREAARRYGLSTAQIGSTLRAALFGREVSRYKEGEEDYPINLRLLDEQRYDLASLLSMRITFRNQNTGKISQVPIHAVADISKASTYGSVKRKDMERVISISSNVNEGYNANEIVAKYKAVLADYQPPEGFTVKFTGEQEEQAKSMAFLMNAMMIAVFLIFLILVSQFNSVIFPGIILFTVIFSTIGVFLGFAIFRMDFSVMMSGIGIISLAGIVVNNAIVLIDYINLLKKRRRSELGLAPDAWLSKSDVIEAIKQGGETRFRPVVLTAITTVLGLVPLAIGLNINFWTLLTEFDADFYIGGDSSIFWAPMAWTIIFGLVVATFLTLVIVPIMYLAADSIQKAIGRVTGGGHSAES